MWQLLAGFILRWWKFLLVLLAISTAFMGWQATQVKLSYEFAKAIPTNNPKYVAYQAFKKSFGDDGNLIVIGVKTDRFFDKAFFSDYQQLQQRLQKIKGVDAIVSVPGAINLVMDYEKEALQAKKIFADRITSQHQLDSSKAAFLSLPFYRGLLYNESTNAWLMGVRMNTGLINSKERTSIVNHMLQEIKRFSGKQHVTTYISGLPYIRTVLSQRIQAEMRWFLIGSVLLSALILVVFFRSASATLLSLAVVIIGVIWSVGILQLCGYKITLLTALIPPLVVVIGIPNCIYFLNKFHTAYLKTGNKTTALVSMVDKMGIVTLFCNIAAAIGFGVFAFTKSAILREFGLVAGISIMALFFISLVLIPIALQVLPAPKPKHTRYLSNSWLQNGLQRLEQGALQHSRLVFSITAAVMIFSVWGMMRLKTEAHIIDDLPKGDKLYTDLKFFEDNFKGVMPLEIVIDTKKRYGATRNLKTLLKVDSMVQYLAAQPFIARPLTITEGLKFAKQAFFEGDSSFYIMPGENDMLALKPYLNMQAQQADGGGNLGRLITSFVDSNRQQVRISAGMKDVGSSKLPVILKDVRQKADQLFDSSRYMVTFTGTSVTFLEGSNFIISGLKESIFWAFLLIALCMMYLFRSGRILLCSLVPNIIPLLLTAGVMGWAGVPLKPSTVLVFSVALGIAIDITIRFLVSYKQLLAGNGFDARTTVVQSIRSTGLSIIYTSIVLIAGFVIFCFSGFGGTKALGWLTSLTLVTATFANLLLLPALMLQLYKAQPAKRAEIDTPGSKSTF